LIISNKDLWKVTGQARYKYRNKEKKIWMDRSHIKKKRMDRYQRLPYFGTLRETGSEEDQEIAGEYR